MTADWAPICKALETLHAGWPAGAWSWDARFGCLVAEFSVELAETIRALVLEALRDEWTASNVSTAPRPLRDLLARSGGLEPGQRLFGATESESIAAFGLWWPWKNGRTISLRLGLLNLGALDEPYPQIRALFGVAS